MAVVPVCYKIPYKDHVLGPQNSVRRLERVIMCRCYAFPQACISGDACKRCQILYPNVDILMKTRTRGEVNTSKGAIFNQDTLHFQNPIEGLALHRVWNVKGEDFYVASHTSKASINEKQLGLLDSYFGKLQGNANKPSSDSSDETIELLDESRQINTKEELESLNSYLGKLNKEEGNLTNYVSPTFVGQATEENPAAKSFSVHEDSRRGYEEKPKNFMKLRKKEVNSGSGRSQTLQQNDETSDLYLISILASVNIAVFLFEIASPGPIFAIIGAWLVYQVQNKGVIAKDVSESLFHKAIITTGLSFILTHFGPIDDWTHLGAALTGIIYGFFTCPTLQLDNASSRTGQDEGVAFVRGYANPCKSLILFAVFILFLGSLLFFVEPPLDTLVPDDLVWF
ncbi:hypothetical protein GH714_032290 [Hevea brasiliensis]|uniref:Peptidase S54 rhomboid domain-containing protein n=1 Tax=Hevea brasiliensis TaxID=3981 RepID=A0A6A6LDL6_HEVBR|nr:hypothetical protein GH714_032290 [Hevea brasiliensis]